MQIRRSAEMAHTCRYTPTVMSGPVVRFGLGYHQGKERDIVSGKEVDRWSAEINASRDGVRLSGEWPIYSDQAAIYHLRKVLEWAWNAHLAIAASSDPHAAAKHWVEIHNMNLLELRAEAAKIGSLTQ